MLLLDELLKSSKAGDAELCEETRLPVESAPLDPNIAKIRIREFINYRKRLHEDRLKDPIPYNEMRDIIAFLFDFDFIYEWVGKIKKYNDSQTDPDKIISAIRVYNCMKPGPIAETHRPDVFLIPVRANGEDFYHVYDSPKVLQARNGQEREIIIENDGSMIGNSSIPCPNQCN